MGIFDKIKSSVGNGSVRSNSVRKNFVDYGRLKDDGGHDHRSNRGKDRTPAQKRADEAKRKHD